MKPDTETCQHPSTRRQEQGTGAVWSPQSQFLTGEGAEPETQQYPLENNTEDSPRGPTPPTPGCAAFWGVQGRRQRAPLLSPPQDAPSAHASSQPRARCEGICATGRPSTTNGSTLQLQRESTQKKSD